MKACFPSTTSVLCLALGGSSLFVGGCGPTAPPVVEAVEEEAGDAHHALSMGGVSTTCEAPTWWRFVAVLHSGVASCPPAPGGWSSRSLFPGATAPELSRYCLYTFPGNVTTTDVGDIAGALNDPSVEAFDPDCMVVAPMSWRGGTAAAVRDEALADLHPAFVDHTGPRLPPAPAGEPRTRLAVLDTHPTLEPSEAPQAMTESVSGHGYAIVNMARDLVCTEAGCNADVASRLALDRLAVDALTGAPAPVATGGLVGTPTILAESIRAEVEQWGELGLGSQRRKVLNLSLGWDARAAGGDPMDVHAMPVFARAALAATEDARCRGALIVAAAGNKTWGPQPTDEPTLPGGWERRSALSPELCSTRYDVWPEFVGSAGAPLVFAAGGLQITGQPLANAVASPTLMAYADHAVVVGGHPSAAVTPILTGTSVSSVVVASAAATVWTFRPELSPEEVMEMVTLSGRELGAAADFCHGGGACVHQRQVNLCSAGQWACPTADGGCPDVAQLDCALPEPMLLEPMFSTQAFHRPIVVSAQLLTGTPLAEAYADVAAAPWPQPQPSGDPPPSIPWLSIDQRALYFVVDNTTYQAGGRDLAGVEINIDGTTYATTRVPLVSGDSVRIDLASVLNTQPSKVALTFLTKTTQGLQSTTVPVLVVRNLATMP